MPVGFSSPARNLFLLGSSGAQVVSNFFESISKASTTDGVFIPDEIRYIADNKKYALAGSAQDSNSKGFGWLERQDYDLETGALTTDYSNRIESTQAGVTTTLRAMELDSNNNLIVVGFSGTTPWIAKYSNDGVLDWQSTTASANVRYLGVTSDSSGNYYACGRTSYTLPDTQAFVEKFDSNGNPSWGKSAFMLGRDVVLAKISANDRGEVVAVGFLEDDSADKGYIVKIDTNTGEVLWDRTLERNISGYGGFVLPSSGDGITPADVKCTACYIDSRDQIYVVGSIDGKGTNDNGVGEFLIKYSPEGNIIWQRERDTRDFINNPSGAPNTVPFDVKSDGETEQTVVLSVDTGPGAVPAAQIELSKYSKSGDLVFRRRINKSGDQLGAASLDADPSFYYFIFRDQQVDVGAGEPDRYTFGKVSTSGNGLGAFQYDDGTATLIDYTVVSNPENKIGRMSDGSVTNSVSDLMTYPFTANQVVFDDLATHVSNKKRQMDSADSFEYSGSPAIRVADFQELNLLGDTGIVAATGTNYTAQISGTQYNASNPKEHAFDGNLSNWTTALNGTSLTWTPSGGLAVSSSLRLYAAREAATDNITVTFTDTSTFNSFTADNTFKWYDITGAAGKTIDNINWTHNNTFSRIAAIEVDGVILVDPREGWTDQSGKGNDGVVNGATHNAAGYWEFDGVDDNVFVDDPQQKLQFVDTGSDFAIECWAKRTAAGSGSFETMLSAWGQGGGIDGWIVAHDAGSLHFTWAPHSQTTTFMTGGTLNLNTWYHIMVTKNGSAFTMYLDGVSVATGTNAGTINTSYDKLEIGHYGNNAGSWFTGHIGEVRIYPRGLTAAAVFQNYNATKSKYINEAPDTAPRISDSAIVYDSNLPLNYDFGNRATYDPVENIVSNSQDNTGWNQVRGAITDVDIISPDGSRGAFLYTESTETGAHHFKIPYNTGGSDYGDEITWSSQLYFKRYGSKNKIRFGLNTKADTYRHLLFDFNTGQVETEINISGTYSVDDVGGGWYRLNLTDNGDTGSTRPHAVMSCFMVQNDTTSTSAYTGDGESGVYFWGPNLKIGGVSRYIRTYGSAITAPTTVKNLSSSSNTGTINGATFNIDKFDFDGVNDRISVAGTIPTIGTGDFAVECWIYLPNVTPTSCWRGIVTIGNGFQTSGGITLYAPRATTPANTVVAILNAVNPTIGGTSNVNDSVWHHVVLTRVSGTLDIYVDNSSEASQSNTANITETAVTLGRDINCGTTFYEGSIGELRIYTSKGLTASEVSQNFNATRGKYGV